ncbi:DNA-binding response regulator, OmpR family, contains REC and winged-helix (wHTH) domain [Fontibacillus panacisegetis]|uniref:DNA-binding response regulator, OmpR family, contains REC and winged-helix (WHTH) domain n=1 Tax=Fontibacillus panacisegetis TaxID=670482 RepID=A0A1G7LCR1_9BACL|nr:response regulator transcription factor [Fontibacillus panacisegetis]SDF47094.1 DNA-binding response regulator, OmpR family, contains REC and winged-helix (wHTH) domain [Fontibacillus panacisegetis]
MSVRLLLVDDERGIVAMMKNYFEMAGYVVYTASNGKEALERIDCNPDLIVLDINMPEMDGLAVCERIRGHISVPILFLTARVESQDKIRGFRAGADDYIVKPFDLDELAARVEAHLRRDQRALDRQSAIRIFGPLVLDYTKREATYDGVPIQLSKREFDIVELLSMNAGQVFDRERIYETIWGLDSEGSDNTVIEHIRKIRAKLAAHTLHGYIDTVWGVGYRWNGSGR